MMRIFLLMLIGLMLGVWAAFEHPYAPLLLGLAAVAFCIMLGAIHMGRALINRVRHG